MIEKAVHTVLAGTSGVTTLVSTRIYVAQAPQDAAFPMIVIRLAGGGEHMQSMDGSSGVNMLRFTVEAISDGYYQARTVLEAARIALHGYSGTSAAVLVQGILTDGTEQYTFNQPIDSSEIGTHSFSQGYLCGVDEPVPA